MATRKRIEVELAYIGADRVIERPLDSFTGTALRLSQADLPRSNSVRRLTAERSALFQAAAGPEAERRRSPLFTWNPRAWRWGRLASGCTPQRPVRPRMLTERAE